MVALLEYWWKDLLITISIRIIGYVTKDVPVMWKNSQLLRR